MTRMCCVGGYGSWSRGNALMREAVRGREKRPGRRPAAPVEQGEDDAGRPAGAEVFAEVDGLLAAVSRPAATHCRHARTGVDEYGALRRRVADVFRESRGRYGYRRVKAALGAGTSEKVIRRIMREDGLVARVPGRRRYSSYEGEAASRAGQPRRPGLHRSRAEREMAHGHHAGSRPVTERCTFRRWSTATTAWSWRTRPGRRRTRNRRDTMPGPGRRHAACRRASRGLTATAVVITGGRDGWNGWAGTAWSGPWARRGAARTTPRPRGSSAV